MFHVASGRFVTWSLLGIVALTPSGSLAQCCGTSQCAGDLDCDGQVSVDEIIRVVDNALHGCVTVSADQACADLGSANCTKLDQCVFNGSTVRYGGASICQERQKEICLVRLGAANTGNNPTDVELCVSEVPAGSCNAFDLGNIPECEARVGSGAAGAPCAFPGQCQSSNCAIVIGTNCGTCAPPNQAGDRCDTVACSHGFTCVKTTQLCEPIGSPGDICDTNLPCGAGLSCVTAAGAAEGSCQASGSSAGTPCDPKHETAPGCDPNLGLYCSGVAKVCTPITYVTAGVACGSNNQGVVACTNAFTCFGNQGTTLGICVANAADGMACDTQAGPACVPPAQCVTGGSTVTSGACRLPDPSACH